MFHKYQNIASIIGSFMKADVLVCACMLTTQILSKRKDGVSELRNNCMLCSHKHTCSEFQCLCQKGGSLFVYCLYTEKRETASIM